MALIIGKIAALPGAAPSEYCSKYFVEITAILSPGIASAISQSSCEERSVALKYLLCMC